ncbi:hypothetical protein GCM10027402_25130 [Arthrobacter monumenti]
MKDVQGQDLTVVPADQLDQALAVTENLLAKATITPEACSVFATESTQVPAGSSYAAGASQSAQQKTLTTITLIAVQDPQVLAEELQQSEQAVDQCSSFTTKVDGQTIKSTIEPMDVQTDGENSFGSVVTQTLPNGKSQTLMSVAGTEGVLAATAVKIGTDLPAGTESELVQLVNDALAKG